MQEIVLKIRCFEKQLSESLKNVNFVSVSSFETSPFLMDKIMKNKRGLELVTISFSGYKRSTNKFLY